MPQSAEKRRRPYPPSRVRGQGSFGSRGTARRRAEPVRRQASGHRRPRPEAATTRGQRAACGERRSAVSGQGGATPRGRLISTPLHPHSPTGSRSPEALGTRPTATVAADPADTKRNLPTLRADRIRPERRIRSFAEGPLVALSAAHFELLQRSVRPAEGVQRLQPDHSASMTSSTRS
jgi:hypothetical protein